MALPSSGPLSISQIAAEFGVGLPCVFPDDFYGKPGVPASGVLVLPDSFHGLSNVVFTPNGGPVNDFDQFQAQVTLSCNLPAVWTYGGIGDAVASLASGGTANSITFSLSGNFQAIFNVTGSAAGVDRLFNVNLEVFEF